MSVSTNDLKWLSISDFTVLIFLLLVRINRISPGIIIVEPWGATTFSLLFIIVPEKIYAYHYRTLYFSADQLNYGCCQDDRHGIVGS